MGNQSEYIDKLVIKLKVLESKIQNLETITDEVLQEVETAYQEQLKVLHQKREVAQQKLLKINGAKKI